MQHRVEWLVAALLLAHFTPAQTSKLLRQEAKLLPFRLVEAKKRGFPMTYEEAFGPAIPDENNAAVILTMADREAKKTFEGLDFNALPSKEIDRTLNNGELYFAKTYLAASTGRFRLNPKDPFYYRPLFALKAAVRRLFFRAEIRARKGDASGALNDIKAAARIGSLPLQQPTLLKAVVASGCSNILTARCEQIADLWEHQPEQLASLEASLKEAYCPINTLDVIRQESVVMKLEGRQWFKENAKRKLRQIDLDGFESMGLAIELRRYDFAAKDPLHPWKNRPSDTALEGRMIRYKSAATYLAVLVVPIFDQTYDDFRKRTAYQNCLASLLRCLQYRATHGHLAASLSEMHADLEDPFAQGALRLVQSSRGFRVYSVGEDGKDDLGATSNEMDDRSKGDIALGLPPVRSRPQKKH